MRPIRVWRMAQRAALGGVLLLAAACGDPPAQAATVAETQGQTFACADSFPADPTACPPATVGAEVRVNGGVHTGAGNATLLMQVGATRFRLLPNSSLRYVESNGAGIRFFLEAGRVFADREPGSDTIVIQSGDSAVTALGTVFTVADEGTQEIVSVLTGTVTVEVPPGSKQTRQVHAGQGMRIPDGATAPPPPSAMTRDELRLWQQVLPLLNPRGRQP
jgi:ferric-dicitrate binding protein FerR (iron transport regulator)